MINKRGFSPVEILIGLSIGSMISLIVMNSISQLSFTLSRTTTLTQVDMSAVLGLHVLEQDFSSACMPEYIHEKEKEEPKKNSTEPQKEKEKKKEYFKKACVIKQADTQLEHCSCISMYTIGKDHTAPKKVFYTLETDTQGDEKLYTLYRQECSDLQAEKADGKGDKKMVVMKHIVSLKMTCWARHLPLEEEKKQPPASSLEPKKKQKKEEKKKEPYKSFTEWDSDKNYKERQDKKNQEHLPLLPDFIDITVVIQQEKGREITYTTTVMLPWGFPELTMIDVAPIVHEKEEKEKQTAHQQLESFSKNAELTGTLNDKVNQLANTMNPGQKEKK